MEGGSTGLPDGLVSVGSKPRKRRRMKRHGQSASTSSPLCLLAGVDCPFFHLARNVLSRRTNCPTRRSNPAPPVIGGVTAKTRQFIHNTIATLAALRSTSFGTPDALSKTHPCARALPHRIEKQPSKRPSRTTRPDLPRVDPQRLLSSDYRVSGHKNAATLVN